MIIVNGKDNKSLVLIGERKKGKFRFQIVVSVNEFVNLFHPSFNTSSFSGADGSGVEDGSKGLKK